MQIEPIKYGPLFIQKMAKEVYPKATVYTMFRNYEGSDVVKHPALRDRVDEMVPAVKGMVGDLNCVVIVKCYTGSEMHHQFGFGAVGADFINKFYIIFG